MKQLSDIIVWFLVLNERQVRQTKQKRDDGNLWPTGVAYINFSLSPFEYENQEGE